MNDAEQSKKLGLELLIFFGFDVFTILSNFVAGSVDAKFNAFLMSFFLKFLGIKEVIAIDDYEFSKLRQ